MSIRIYHASKHFGIIPVTLNDVLISGPLACAGGGIAGGAGGGLNAVGQGGLWTNYVTGDGGIGSGGQYSGGGGGGGGGAGGVGAITIFAFSSVIHALSLKISQKAIFRFCNWTFILMALYYSWEIVMTYF